MIPGVKRRAHRVKRILTKAGRRFRYHDFMAPKAPIVLANSFPKSGTNLLRQVLTGFCELGPFVDNGDPVIATFESATGRQRSIHEILDDLKALKPGDIATSHLHVEQSYLDFVCAPGWVNYFIYRDPRDVVVSHLHHIMDLRPDHVHHVYYSQLKNDEERLRTSILGRPELSTPFPNIAERFAPYIGWLERDEVLALKFEDLIDAREESLEKILAHFEKSNFKFHESRSRILETLGASIDPQRSPTFREGRIGSWRECFTPELTMLFNNVAGDLLRRLGYGL